MTHHLSSCTILPEYDVVVSAYVPSSVHNFGPVFPWPHSKLGVTLIGEGLEVPRLWLEHVIYTICTHWHHHLRTGLHKYKKTSCNAWVIQKTKANKVYCKSTIGILYRIIFQNQRVNIYLVEPTQHAQIPSSSLWGVKTQRISRVIVVNSYGLRDAMQQLFLRYASIKPKMCADLLGIITPKRKHSRVKKQPEKKRLRAWVL